MMGSKLTPKQTKFAQVYVECGNASEAYRQSYNVDNMKPESVNRLAKANMDNIKIASRIEELQEALRKKHEVTASSLTEDARKAVAFAEEQGSPAAYVSALTLIAKLHGLLIDRQKVDGEMKFSVDRKFTK